jgi:hypothetical protein
VRDPFSDIDSRSYTPPQDIIVPGRQIARFGQKKAAQGILAAFFKRCPPVGFAPTVYIPLYRGAFALSI